MHSALLVTIEEAVQSAAGFDPLRIDLVILSRFDYGMCEVGAVWKHEEYEEQRLVALVQLPQRLTPDQHESVMREIANAEDIFVIFGDPQLPIDTIFGDAIRAIRDQFINGSQSRA